MANDGSVIDTADIRRIALSGGLTTAADFDATSRDEQLRYIFHGSFSTKRVVSQVSGRGFGLSAVKHAVEALQGDYPVASDAAHGSGHQIAGDHPRLRGDHPLKWLPRGPTPMLSG